MTKNYVPWLRHGDKTGGYIRRSVTCRSSLCSDDGISSLRDICKQSLTEKKDNKETHNIYDTNVFQSLCSRMAAAFNINALILLKVGALGSSFPSFWWTFSPNVIKQLGVSAVFWKYCLNNRYWCRQLHQYQTPNGGRPPLFPSSFSITETMTVIRVWLCRFICVCVLPKSSGSHCYVLLFTINCMLAELLYSQCQTLSFHLLQWIPSFCSWCHSWDCSTCFSLPARAPLWIIGVCGLYNYSSGLPKCESGTQSGFRLIKAPWTHTMTLFVVKWLLSSLQLLHLSVIAIWR